MWLACLCPASPPPGICEPLLDGSVAIGVTPPGPEAEDPPSSLPEEDAPPGPEAGDPPSSLPGEEAPEMAGAHGSFSAMVEQELPP